MAGTMQNIIVGLLIFGGIITGVFLYETSLSSYSGSGIAIANNSALNSAQKIENATKVLKDSISSSQITGTFLDVPLTIVSSIYNVLVLLMTTLTEIASGVIGGLVSTLGAPPWVEGLLLSLAAITIIFAVVAAAFRWEI